MSSTKKTRADVPVSNSSKSRWTLIGYRLLAVLLSLVAGVGLVELAFRWLPDTPWYERIVLEQLPDRGGVILNVAGRRMKIRAEPPQTPKPPGTHRIMFLGDSFTFGVGLDDPADTFVSLIGARLERERPCSDVTRYEVCNAGLPALYTDSWRALFAVYGGAYDPDLVVAVFFLRDGVRGVATSGQIREIRAAMSRFSREQGNLYRYSRTYRFFLDRLELARVSRRYLARLQNGYMGTNEEKAEWRRAQANLLDVRDKIERRGGRFALVIFPMLYELDADYPLLDVCNEIERFARDNGIVVHSLLPTYLGLDGPSLWVSMFNQHPNERGHALAAESIYEFLVPIIRSPSSLFKK